MTLDSNATPVQVASQLVDIFEHSLPSDAVDQLMNYFRQNEQWEELFNLHKMRSRLRVGLSPVPMADEAPIPEDKQDQLEREMLEACKEVGAMLLRKGKLEEGWMYMRPVGDKEFAANVLADVEINQENVDAMLHLLVQEGLDVARGTQASLELRGICNTITMMDMIVKMRGRADQQASVTALIHRVHQELLENVREDIERRKIQNCDTSSLQSILKTEPTLLRDGSYHMDTTHVASTVRFSRVLDDHEVIQKAIDLCHYGVALHPNYQYPSEEPFADLYSSSLIYLQTLLGVNPDAGLRFFRSKAEDVDVREHGPVAIETYVDLLARIGRNQEALDFLIRKMPEGERPFGIAPSILELCDAVGDYSPMIQRSQERGDLVGLAAALLQGKSRS